MKIIEKNILVDIHGGFAPFAAFVGGIYTGYTHDDQTYHTVAQGLGTIDCLISGYQIYTSAGVITAALATNMAISMAVSFPVIRGISYLGYRCGEYTATWI